MLRTHPRSTLFPYTTLFRSRISLNEIATEMTPMERTKHFQLLTQVKKLEAKRPTMPTAIGIQDADGPLPKTFVRSIGVDRKSTRLNSSHVRISYAVFCLKKK